MKIIARCPTRVDLAGGTLDLWPIFSFLGGAYTINAAIDIFTQAELTKLDNSQITIEIENTRFKKSFKDLNSLLKDKNPKLNFIRPQLEYWKPIFGFHLKTSSQSPMGGGLGGSSSLTISIIAAFSEMEGHRLTTHEMVRLAHNIEAKILKTPTGTQDYIPPIEGGVNLINYGYGDFKVKKLNILHEIFDKQFLLVYTGKPHHSGLNNWQVLKKVIDGDKKTLKCLAGLKDVSEKLLEQINKKDWNFKKIFQNEYKWRSQISKSFSSPEIKRLEKLALKNGALAIKICGAGGGGSVIVWCADGQKEKVTSVCQKAGFQVLKANVIDHGISIQRLTS
jgi:D-glycero-alpha-D-manno-heptose-7-phosphate kinase